MKKRNKNKREQNSLSYDLKKAIRKALKLAYQKWDKAHIEKYRYEKYIEFHFKGLPK